MLRGLYTASTGMAVQRAKMDVMTNNIVNAETTGFKKDSLVSSSFADVMMERLNDPNVVNRSNEVGPFNFGTHIDEVYTDYSQGSPEATGSQTDLAIAGDGLFVVNTPDGQRYTRAGDFLVDSDGYLVTGGGNYVQGMRGSVHVGDGDFTVDTKGTVTVNGQTVDTLRTVAFADPGVLRKQGDNLYDTYGNAAPQAAGDCEILQGYREGSNVSIGDEMVNMITVYRTYEASQKVLKMTDETLGFAVNDLGSLR